MEPIQLQHVEQFNKWALGTFHKKCFSYNEFICSRPG